MHLTKRILVPLDGSERSELALELAAPLLSSAQEVVELLRMVPPLPLASPLRPLRAGQEGHVEAERVAVLRELREVSARFKSNQAESLGEFQVCARVGEPAGGIVDRAAEIQASLIVMATQGSSGLTRWVRGSVAERVLRHTKTPLFLVQAQSTRPLKRILVPLDGSEGSAAVLPFVEDLAKAFGSEVVLLHVGLNEGGELSTTPEGGVTRVTEALIREGLEPYRSGLERAGVVARTRALFGNPATKILETLKEIDLIAMTSHGRRGFDRWAFGSVAERVLRGCTLPLLLVPLRGRPEAP